MRAVSKAVDVRGINEPPIHGEVRLRIPKNLFNPVSPLIHGDARNRGCAIGTQNVHVMPPPCELIEDPEAVIFSATPRQLKYPDEKQDAHFRPWDLRSSFLYDDKKSKGELGNERI